MCRKVELQGRCYLRRLNNPGPGFCLGGLNAGAGSAGTGFGCSAGFAGAFTAGFRAAGGGMIAGLFGIGIGESGAVQLKPRWPVVFGCSRVPCGSGRFLLYSGVGPASIGGGLGNRSGDVGSGCGTGAGAGAGAAASAAVGGWLEAAGLAAAAGVAGAALGTGE